MKLVKILFILCVLCLVLISTACGKKGPPTAVGKGEEKSDYQMSKAEGAEGVDFRLW